MLNAFISCWSWYTGVSEMNIYILWYQIIKKCLSVWSEYIQMVYYMRCVTNTFNCHLNQVIHVICGFYSFSSYHHFAVHRLHYTPFVVCRLSIHVSSSSSFCSLPSAPLLLLSSCCSSPFALLLLLSYFILSPFINSISSSSPPEKNPFYTTFHWSFVSKSQKLCGLFFSAPLF